MRHRPTLLFRISLSCLIGAFVVACGDGGKRRAAGDSCDGDADCTTGLCYASICLDPEADDDGDGVVTRLELELGTNPTAADSDGDGKTDRDELDANLGAVDTDGDGKIDAIESILTDADRDCAPDEADPRDDVPEGTTSPLLATLCPQNGVCTVEGAVMAVMCLKGLDQPACDLRGVPFHENTESACDQRDNDCDGQTDEGCGLVHAGLVGHWMLDADAQDNGPWRTHGELGGGVGVADRFGTANGAVRFDGGAAPMTVALTRHPAGSGDFSYAFWLRPDAQATDTMGIFGFGEAADGRRTGILAVPNGPYETCLVFDAVTAAPTGDAICVPAQHWTFIVLTRSGDTLTLHANGIATTVAKQTTPIDLRRFGFSLGASRVLADGGPFLPFAGAIDDFRLYDRVLSSEEIGVLFAEGDWTLPGQTANPAQGCRHARDLGGDDDDGPIRIDADGDGPLAALSVFCDQTTDGGGWTLVWAYDFAGTSADFAAPANHVTPIPEWPVATADASRSNSAPTGPDTSDAVPWALWDWIGHDFRVVNDLIGDIACDSAGAAAGSLATGVEGDVACRYLGDVQCDGALPDWVFFWEFGPGLSSSNLFVYFDGSSTENWPTHDPCGANAPPPADAPLRGGAVYLR
jgi:hypothetical protein